MPFSEAFRNATIDGLVAGGHAALYLDNGTEVSGTGYARLALSGQFDAASGGVTDNNAALEWSNPNVDWTPSPRTITEVRIFSAATGGTQQGDATVPATTVQATTETLRIPIGDLDLSFTNS